MNIHTHSVYCIYHLNVNHLGRFLFLDCRIVCSNERNFPQNVCAHAHTHFAYQKKKNSYYLHEQQQSIMNSVAIFIFVYSFALFIRAAHFKTRLPSVWQELTNWEKRMKKATTNRMRWAVKNHCSSSISSCAPYKHTGEHKTKRNKRINIYKIYVKTM